MYSEASLSIFKKIVFFADSHSLWSSEIMEEGLYCLMFVTVEKSMKMFYILFFFFEIPFFPF